ncbi:MAG: hypothetical protein HYY76_00235, partial [Acidobacteria bacterium]|nr:hypothetical protein [Acidobacteriota bacterium]
LDLRLRDDQAIERVAVMTRQLCDVSGVSMRILSLKVGEDLFRLVGRRPRDPAG